MAGKRSQWINRGNPKMQNAPIANRAKSGGNNRKAAKNLAQRVQAWSAPESKRFQEQIASGGAKCPGSLQFH